MHRCQRCIAELNFDSALTAVRSALAEQPERVADGYFNVRDDGSLVNWFVWRTEAEERIRDRPGFSIKAFYLGTPPPDKPPFDAVAWMRSQACERCISPQGEHYDCRIIRRIATALEAAMKEEGRG